MKAILLTSFLFIFSFSSYALERDFVVKERKLVTKKGKEVSKKLIEKTVTLKELLNDRNFEGKYFKIVKNKSDLPISFNSDKDLLLKAATAYYHLSKAKAYYDSLPGFDYEYKDKQITVRIEVNHDLSEHNHFNVSREKYNHAQTIEASNPRMLAAGYQPWNREIWFHAPKEIKSSSQGEQLGNYIDSRGFKNMLLEQLLFQDVTSLTQNIALKGSSFTGLDAQYHLTSMLFSLGLSELFPKFLRLTGKLVKQTQYLDTVLIPEIVHHEFGHIALADTFGIRSSTALSEAFPNFFAQRIAKTHKLSAKSGKLNRGFTFKNGESNQKYSLDQETKSQMIHGSFTYSLLNDLEDELGDEGLDIIVKSLEFLEPDSDIKMDLPYAISDAIHEIGSHPLAQDIGAKNVFIKRGM